MHNLALAGAVDDTFLLLLLLAPGRYRHPRFVWVEWETTDKGEHAHGPALCWCKGTERAHHYKVAPLALFDDVVVGELPENLHHVDNALERHMDERAFTLRRHDCNSDLNIDMVVRLFFLP